MNLFEQSYNDFIQFAIGIINKYKSNFSPADLVNEAFIQTHNQEFSPNAVRKAMLDFCLDEHRRQQAHCPYTGVKHTEIREETAVCPKCNEILPIAAFPVLKVRWNTYVQNVCRDCHNKARRKYPERVIKIKRGSQYKLCPVPLNGEEWVEHPTYKGLLASNYGRIKDSEGYLKAEHLQTKGYKYFRHNNKSISSHRFIAEAFIENADGMPDVCHKNGVKTYNHPSNLEWNRRNTVAHHRVQTLVRKDSDIRQQWRKANTNRLSKDGVREKHNSNQVNYNKFHKDNLTDIYIRQLLRGRGAKACQITQAMIDSEREKQLSKRSVTKAA